jgi:hypothetical protein
MALKIRRGTESQRSTITFASGEIIWTTNGHKLYVGDGVTPGGIDIAAQLGGVGLTYNGISGKLDLNLGSTTSDSLTEGNNHLYFTTQRAQQAAGAALVAGNTYNTGVTFSYDDVNGRITAVVSNSGLPSQVGNNGKFLTTDGAGTLSWAPVPATGLTSVSGDSSPSLGGNLGLASHTINGTGNINISGDITTIGSVIVNTGNITSTNFPPNDGSRSAAKLNIGGNTSPTTAWIYSNQNFVVSTGLTDGTNNSGNLHRVSRGTLASKTSLQPGDSTVYIEGQGWDGTSWVTNGALILAADPNASITTGHIPGVAGLLAMDSSGNPKFMTFNSKGVLNAPVIKASGYPTGSEPTSAEEGWIIFNSTTKQFLGFNGTTWVQLS